jgi:hypothetical protein
MRRIGMRIFNLEIKDTKKEVYSGHLKLGGSNPKGDRIGFTNYFMELNGAPYFVICGEYHYSRYQSSLWEDEILKMKAGGLNTVATYIIWNHHEEEEGNFIWEGDKNLRYFAELCKKHNMFLILRIGPFAHGEVRNGGFPDWLYGRPFNVRSNDEGYLYYTERLYNEIGRQVEGLLYKDGGTIIGVQLENEFQAAGAPWETTPPQTLEWIESKGGVEHMIKLKEMALIAGFDVPLYTSTGWGGAPIIENEVLPLYGGYAFWPWIFYGDVTEHPATGEYLFQDFHNDNVEAKDFKPAYKKSNYPFACCEIGGGMQVWYNYRFIVPPESVEAMTLVKTAGGCNFVGYYMYHGGSNPIGKHSYLNERTTPKISYDFQAPLGEFGQVRESYKRAKLLHYFFSDQQEKLCKMSTVLPEDNKSIEPTDTKSLRYAVRAKDGAGYVFLNNYQDHVEIENQEDFKINLCLDNEEISIPESRGLSFKKGSCCILPFNFKLDEVMIKYATTQFISTLQQGDITYGFFFTLEGMISEFCLKGENIKNITVSNGAAVNKDGNIFVNVDNTESSIIEITTKNHRKIVLYALTRQQSLNFWKAKLWGEERVILTNGNVIASDNKLKLTSVEKAETYLKVFPHVEGTIVELGRVLERKVSGDIFEEYEINLKGEEVNLNIERATDNRVVITFKEEDFSDAKELFLRIDYIGDVGYAYIQGKLINDNFCNGTTWEIGLKKYQQELLEKGMYLYIAPTKKGGIVKRDSAMAAVKEIGGEQTAVIKSITAVKEKAIEIIPHEVF